MTNTNQRNFIEQENRTSTLTTHANTARNAHSNSVVHCTNSNIAFILAFLAIGLMLFGAIFFGLAIINIAVEVLSTTLSGLLGY